MPLPLSFLRRRSRSPLTRAIQQNDAKKIAYILANTPHYPTARHLTSAISNASYSALKALLRNFHTSTLHSSALVTTHTQDTLTTALHAAVAALDSVSVSLLLSSDVSPRAVQNSLEPLHIATRANCKTRAQKHALTLVINVLVSAGALQGNFQEHLYPPNYAVTCRNHHAFSAMLSHPSQSLSTSLHKYSTIRYVCTHASIQDLSTLLPHINIKQPDAYRSTPLHHAVSSPHAKESAILTMVQIILRAGCPVNTRDMYGRSPFQIARTRHMQRVVNFLVASGASQETYAQVLLRRAQREARKKATRIINAGKVVSPKTGKCSICLDGLSSKRAVKMSCGHTHHSECLSDWVVSKPSCPLCKHGLP